jgi:hypothetical protein
VAEAAIASTIPQETIERKHLHDQIEALRERGMTEYEKNQRVITHVKQSEDFLNL